MEKQTVFKSRVLLIPSRKAQRVEISALTHVSGTSFSGGTYSHIKTNQADKAGAWECSCSELSCSAFVLKSNGLVSPCFPPVSPSTRVALSPQSLEGPWRADECQNRRCAEERLGHKQVQAPSPHGKPMPENISAWRDTCNESDFGLPQMEKSQWWKLFWEGLSQLSCPKSCEDSLAARKMDSRSPFPYNDPVLVNNSKRAA